MNERTYTLLCPFGGLGAGALGFIQAETRLFETRARFKLLGGIDVDAAACADFEYLTGVPEWHADVWDVTPEMLRERFGPKGPDVVFLSPPCKGSSRLLSDAKAKTAKYRKLNKLALRWVALMLEAWKDSPPRLVLLENVPGVTTRAARMLQAVRGHLRRAGYVMHDGVHDAGEIGGLAQRRRRFLLVARHQKTVSSLLYQPVKKRVRACGEVLGPLPIPNDPEGGPMHRLPQIGWLNWVRLALIPAGGDWRDLPGVLEDGQERRDVFKRHAVEDWQSATGTVGGSGSNGVENVADPRAIPVAAEGSMGFFGGTYGVAPWEEPSGAVTGRSGVSTGSFSVADPRVGLGKCRAFMTCTRDAEIVDTRGGATIPACRPCYDARPGFKGAHGVKGWEEPMGTVAGESLPSNGAFAVADPRVGSTVAAVSDAGGDENPQGRTGRPDRTGPGLTCKPRGGAYGVTGWHESAKAVTGATSIDAAEIAVADPRMRERSSTTDQFANMRRLESPPPLKLAAQHGPNTHNNKYVVGDWDKPSRTVIGATRPGSGAQSVADPRFAAQNAGNDRHDDHRGDPAFPRWFGNVLRIVSWGEPTGTVTHSPAPSSGAIAVADPRFSDLDRDGKNISGAPRFGRNVSKRPPRCENVDLHAETSTDLQKRQPRLNDFASGGKSDPRLKASDVWDRGAAMGVVPFDRPFGTVTAGTMPGQGAYSVADPRVEKAALVGIVTLDDARATVTGGIRCPFAIVDPSSDGPPIMVLRSVDKAPPAAPVILAADGTWHRPLTTLELAVLQGLPALHRGAPLALEGTSSSAHRERIGNAVPVQAATAIAEQMLLTLLSSDLQSFQLSSGGGVWVSPEVEAAFQ